MKKLFLLLPLLFVIACNGTGGGANDTSSFVPTPSSQLSLKTQVNNLGNQDLTSLKMQIYSVYAGENEDCSDLVKIADYDLSPIEVDLMNSESIGILNVSNGSYNCIALTIDRRIKFNPTTVPAGVGSCVANNENTLFISDYSLLHGETHTTFDKQDINFNTIISYIDDVDRYPHYTSYNQLSYMSEAGLWFNWSYRETAWNEVLAGISSGFSDLYTQFGDPFVDYDGIPLHKATLYMSTKVGVRHPDFRLVPPYAANWSWDGAEYDGSHAYIFDHGGDEVSNYIVNPIDITGKNDVDFVVEFGNSLDIINNSVSGECKLQNFSFDLIQNN